MAKVNILPSVHKTVKEVQERLKFLHFYNGALSDVWDTLTEEAVKKFQSWGDLDVDGIVGPKTAALLFTSEHVPAHNTKPSSHEPMLFDAESQKELDACHPLLKKVLIEARKRIPFQILESRRGRAEQELAFRRKTSKVHYGDSAHNWKIALAADCVPIHLDWDDLPSFKKIGHVIMEVAKELKVPMRWLGDPNRDGDDSDGWDFPHVELHPWRDYRGQSEPYRP